MASLSEAHPRLSLEVTMGFAVLRLLYRLLRRSPAVLAPAALEACPSLLDLVSGVLCYAGPHAELPLTAASLLGVLAGGGASHPRVQRAWASPLLERNLLDTACQMGEDGAESVLFEKITMLLGFLPQLAQ